MRPSKEYYDRLECSFHKLLPLTSGARAMADAESVEEDLSYGEYGLALEDLCARLLDAGVSLTSDVYADIAKLGSTMQMDSQTCEPLLRLVSRENQRQ